MALVNHWGGEYLSSAPYITSRDRGGDLKCCSWRCSRIDVKPSGPASPSLVQKVVENAPGRRRRRSSGHADRPRLLYFVAQTFERVIRSI